MLAASPGEWVRRLREIFGLTHIRLVEMAGVKQSDEGIVGLVQVAEQDEQSVF
jgi:hypothetical protein